MMLIVCSRKPYNLKCYGFRDEFLKYCKKKGMKEYFKTEEYFSTKFDTTLERLRTCVFIRGNKDILKSIDKEIIIEVID